jgi:hypothetical protein
MNFIQSHARYQPWFQSLLLEINAEYRDVLYRTEVLWLSLGTVANFVLTLRPEIEMIMNEKGKVVDELC